MLKKCLVGFLLLVVMLMPLSNVLAAKQSEGGIIDNSYSENEKEEIAKIIASDPHFKIVDQLPEGLGAIEISTAKELRDFIKSMKSPDPTYTYVDKLPSVGGITPATAYGIVTRSCSKQLNGQPYLTVWADISVASDGSFRWIDSVLSTRVGLTGVTAGFSLTDAYSYAYNQTGQSVSITGGGIVNSGIVTPWGLVILYSNPESCSFTYSVY